MVQREQFADSGTSHQIGAPSLNSASSNWILETDQLGTSQPSTRTPSYRIQGKMRADQAAIQPASPRTDIQQERLPQDDRYPEAVEGPSTSTSRYPSPPPEEPPPLSPVPPSLAQLSSPYAQRTESPLPGRQRSKGTHRITTEHTHTNGQPDNSTARLAGSDDIPKFTQGTASLTEGLASSNSSRPYPEPRPSLTFDSPTSMKSPSRSRNRIPSKEILQTALDLAQQAVERDGANDIPGAISLYRDAVEKLRTVMGRVGLTLEPLSPELGLPEPNQQERVDREAAAGRRTASGASRSAEEGKTLKGIVSLSVDRVFLLTKSRLIKHDAYVARIGLLTHMNGNGTVLTSSTAANTVSIKSRENLAPHTSSTQAATHIGPARISDEGVHGVADAASSSHNEGSAGQPIEALSSRQTRRLDTIVTDTRPPISQRTASLSAYPNHLPNHGSAPSMSSPSSRSFGREGVVKETEQDISHAFVISAEQSSRSSISVDTAIDLGTTRLRSPFPTRPARSPLRSSPQPGFQSHEDSPSSHTGQPDSSPQTASTDKATQTRQRTISDLSTNTLKAAPSTSPSTSVRLPPLGPVHYPFEVLRQIRSSMTSPHGALVSQGLYVPHIVWSITEVKLPALDTKFRVMVLLSQSLSTLTESGRSLLQTGELDRAVSVDSATLKTFVVALDDLEALTVEIQKMLAKKVGDGKAFAKPRRSNTVRSACWMLDHIN